MTRISFGKGRHIHTHDLGRVKEDDMKENCSACLWEKGWAVESNKGGGIISHRGASVHEDIKGPYILQYGWMVNWF